MVWIDYQDRRPIYEQITERFKEMILKGILKPDSQLPSVRTLAMELSINPNTIQRAYGELDRLGLTYTVKGKGIFIRNNQELLKMQQDEVFEKLGQTVKRAWEAGIDCEEFVLRARQLFSEMESRGDGV